MRWPLDEIGKELGETLHDPEDDGVKDRQREVPWTAA